MAILKTNEILKMSQKDRDTKLSELKMELIKNKINVTKGGKLKTRELKKTIARILTINRLNKSNKQSVENK